MAEYKYGTGYTSVKVRHAPGGQSSINLGWDDPPSAVVSSFKADARNSEKRRAVQDPFKSRDGGQRYPEPEEYARPGLGQNYGQMREVPSNPHLMPVAYSPNPGLNFNENYFQAKNEPYRPQEYPMGQNYFRPPENDMNYFRPPESFQKDLNYAPPQYGLPPRPPVYENKPEPISYLHKEQTYQANPNGQQRFHSPAQKQYPPSENYPPPEYRQEDRRNAPGYVKNSVRVSNPPGGQSTFSFG